MILAQFSKEAIQATLCRFSEFKIYRVKYNLTQTVEGKASEEEQKIRMFLVRCTQRMRDRFIQQAFA
jgi:hypothetical protein